MTAFLNDMTLLSDFFFESFYKVWHLIQEYPFLLAFFGLWILEKIFDVFGIIKG